jgi:ABC-type glycerol-3-phosphate transport system substrate-binding protein
MKSVLAKEDINNKLEPSYYTYYGNLQDEGKADAKSFRLSIPSMSFTARSSEGTQVENDLGGKQGQTLALVKEDSWAEYSFDVPEDGFYQMGMNYYALQGNRSNVVQTVMVDGKYPFYQAKKIEFPRMWKESGKTWYDNQGNEYNPQSVEVFGWQYRDFRDAESKVSDPFRFYLNKGKHVIRISAVREPAAIGDIAVFSPVRLPKYADVLQTYKQEGYQAVQHRLMKVQAENTVSRSSPTLKRVEDREPLTEPFNKNAVALNTFGGGSWKQGGQWAEWEFEVPESGLYQIGARVGQWFLNGVPVERSVSIDGKIPFAEMENQKFPYSTKFQMTKFGPGSDGALFYLAKGKHTIRMEVQIGDLGRIFETVNDVSHNMSLLGREVIRVTGTNPDPNRDWELDNNIANLKPRLYMMAEDLDNAIQTMYGLGVQKGSSAVSSLYEARDELLSMAKDTSTIPARLQAMTDQEAALGQWVNDLSTQSLLIDYFVVKSPDEKWPVPQASWLVRTGTMVYDFLHSFTKTYGGVGNVYDKGQSIEVWVARGRDWADIIKQMIDEEFTPKTGIKVNVNVIPAQQMQVLLLANTAGLAPDVALGVDGEVPIDYAVRNGLVNLNKFPDYPEIANRFRPGALIPYKYNGGDYALPENQNFYMLFYRKDIMEELGITEDKIPQTWSQVEDLIPLLQQNGMNFYYPHAPNNPNGAINEFAPFLFQSRGDLYTPDDARSALDSPQGLAAVKLWTGLFTNYKLEKQADFYNRFRSGEMPIGVADYNTYVLLSTAAPELTGWWGMKPMPGIKQADGQIDRSTGGLGQTGIIFKSSKKQEQAWEFLKWWTSTDTQVEFGDELESLLGVGARWNTANVEALKRLPWNQSDIDAILQQWDWFRERKVVVGGYYTNRYIANIWNEVVLNGQNPRVAIEDGVRDINRELAKKREEFGLNGASKQISAGGDAK